MGYQRIPNTRPSSFYSRPNPVPKLYFADQEQEIILRPVENNEVKIEPHSNDGARDEQTGYGVTQVSFFPNEDRTIIHDRIINDPRSWNLLDRI